MPAFWDYAETIHLLPDEGRRRRVLPRYLGSDLRDAAAEGWLDIGVVDGRIVGAAAWLGPEAYPVNWRRQLREALHLAPAAPWGLGALREALRGQAANRDEHRRHPPHLWLRVLGVRPEHQGDGIGAAVLAPGLARADAAGLGCFLFTASEDNVAWYGRLGFEEVARFHPTPGWPLNFAMWRPCSTSSG